MAIRLYTKEDTREAIEEIMKRTGWTSSKTSLKAQLPASTIYRILADDPTKAVCKPNAATRKAVSNLLRRVRNKFSLDQEETIS
tara:strand:+ start:4789 stop:5040 length:252 start_codon:yes stop_codon:yes gene_type:complete